MSEHCELINILNCINDKMDGFNIKVEDVVKSEGMEKSAKTECDASFGKSHLKDSLHSAERRKGLTSIIENLKVQKYMKDKSVLFTEEMQFGDTGSTDALTESTTTPITKPRRRRPDRSTNNVTITTTAITSPADFHNNNHVKNERLSPGTPDTSSRSITPSSASHPDTPPAPETNPMLHISSRNYSDFMRSLAAKYNNANPNEYFSRNGFPPPIDPRFKPGFPLLSALQTPNKEDLNKKTTEFSSLLNPFAGSAMFPPLIDMSTTQTLLNMVKTAKEAELQGLLKNAKRTDPSSPLDLSAAAPPPLKRARIKTPSTGSVGSLCGPKRAESESPKLHEDISHWSVDDVCNFVQSIDICAEYAQNFKDQRIDGSGLPLLTEEHLTSTMNMKLGPALKLKSVLAKKLGSCSVCLHCSHCHSGNSPESGHTTGNNSDSGGNS